MKMKLHVQFLLYALLLTQWIWAHGIHHHDGDDDDGDHDHEEGEEHHDHDEKEYPVSVTLAGIAAVLICSFLGTVLPILFKNKWSFFHEDTMLFNSVKLFGTGVILGVAFIHMVLPAGQILTSEYTYRLFYETYPSFVGVFVILGILLTHLVQVYTSHVLGRRHPHPSSTDSLPTYHDPSRNEKTSPFSSRTLDITEEGEKWHQKNNQKEMISTRDGCAEDQHGILHLMESQQKEKQLVSYLLEMGISLHSILIGIAFGMTRDEELLVLMVALIFHQFFEGVSLSSVFIEAHFKHLTAILVMIVVYSLTLPLGAVIGLLIRNTVESTDRLYLTLQGIIDAVAGGILVYDVLVNILSRHCHSAFFQNGSLLKKNIQLICFYLGIAVMAIIGIWA